MTGLNLNAQNTSIKTNSEGIAITSISAYEGAEITWPECVDACYKLEEGGFTDWRMPTMSEAVYYRTTLTPSRWIMDHLRMDRHSLDQYSRPLGFDE